MLKCSEVLNLIITGIPSILKKGNEEGYELEF